MDSKRRSRTRKSFNLEQLDARVVLSTIGSMSFDHIVNLPPRFGQLHQIRHNGVNHDQNTTGSHGEHHNLTLRQSRFRPFSGVPVQTLIDSIPVKLTIALPTVAYNPPAGPATSATTGGSQQVVQTQNFLVNNVPASSTSSAGNTGTTSTTSDNVALSVPPSAATTLSFPSAPLYQPPQSNSLTTAQQNKLGYALTQIFDDFEKGDTSDMASVAQEYSITINGDLVTVGVRTPVTLTQLSSELTLLGMQNQTQYPGYSTIQGQISIAQLGHLAALADATSISPVTNPTLHVPLPQGIPA